MSFDQRSSLLPSTERAPHHTPIGIPYGRCSSALALSLACDRASQLSLCGVSWQAERVPLSPLLVTRRHIPKVFQGGIQLKYSPSEGLRQAACLELFLEEKEEVEEEGGEDKRV